jgi:ArsR family transcriptional regulator
MSLNFEKDSEILKVLGHPLRLRIVAGLAEISECNVNNIVSKLKIPQSTASQHLGILKNRGIIAPRKEGVKTCYRVVDKRVIELLQIFKK